MRITHPEEILPLTPQAQYILLALAKEQNSGYGIIKQAKEDSQGLIELSTGTVYPSLKQFILMDYVDQVGDHTYRLTDMGRKTLDLEIERQQHIAELATQRAGLR